MIRALLKGLMTAWLRMTVQGEPMNVLNNERTLIVANHVSFLDGLLLALFLPANATFVVHTTVLRNPFFRWALGFIPHLAVDVTSPMAMKKVMRLLESGVPVVLFPEGRLTRTGSLMKIYEGAAFVAARTGATVVRVRIDGVVHSWFTRLKGMFPRKMAPRVTLTLMPPLRLHWPTEGAMRDRRDQVSDELRRAMVDMLVRHRPPATLFDEFLNSMALFGRNYRLIEDLSQEEKSYGDLLKMAMGARRITGRFTQADERVGVLLPNVAGIVGAVYGLSAGRRVPVMLNYSTNEANVQAILNYNVRHVLTSRLFVEKANLQPMLNGLTNVTIHWMENEKASLTLLDKIMIGVMTLFPRLFVVAQDPEQPAVILATSGSESEPKAVVHSHRSILSNVAQVRAVADFTPHDKFMVALPMFHSFGFTAGMVLPIVAGCKAFFYPSPLHYRAIPNVSYDRDCTVLFGTNTFLKHYGRFGKPMDFQNMRYIVAGAEKLTDEVRDLWINKFMKVVMEGYGVTECAPVVAVNTPMAYKRGTVGQLLPGIDYFLEEVPGIDVGGVLHVKGPNVMTGYLDRDQPERCRPLTSMRGDGWYCTGDIVTVDAQRFVTIQGRLKRFAKIAGEMVSLVVAESLALAASPAGSHGVVARPDANKGEALVLFTTDPNIAREHLLAQAREKGLPELAVARDIRVVPSIPLLGTGKTDYVSLQKLVA